MATATRTEARPDAVASRETPERAGRFEYRPALDGVRALAMLTIIAYHYNYEWAKGGFISVDTFFVLSGFLITTLLVLEYRRRTTIPLANFWARRARRLLPALLIVLCFVAVYTQMAVLPWDRTRVRGDGFASLFYVANWRFIYDNQDYFAVFSPASPLRHMWTLAIEEQYYLVWPVVVFACLRVARGSLRVLAWVCAVGAIASVALMNARFVPGDPARAYYATDARAQALLVGGLLALVLLVWTPSARACRAIGMAAVVAVVVLFAGFWTLSGTAPGYYRGASLFFAAMSALVVAGAMHPGPVSRVLGLQPFPWIGQISYGLYLWHWPITVWLVPSRVSLGPTALNALRLFLTFVAAAVSYYLVEKPVRERSAPPRTTLFVFAPAVAIVVAVVWWSASGATSPPTYLVGATAQAASAVADGSAPPDFVWGYGDPFICGEPRPWETSEAVAAATKAPALTLPASARQERVLLLGDSTACSLWPGLDAVGHRESIATDQGAVFGCGIATDEVTTTRNEAVTPHSDRCGPLLDWVLPRAIARARPTVVLWMSTWEKSDLVVDGRTLVADTPEWEAEVMSRMDRKLDELTSQGARVAMVTEAAPAPNPAQGTETVDRAADDAGYGRLNVLLRRFAARHPDRVTIVDLATRVCPSGPPCPSNVDGQHLRPDGHHFTPTYAVWAAQFVLQEIFHQ